MKPIPRPVFFASGLLVALFAAGGCALLLGLDDFQDRTCTDTDCRACNQCACRQEFDTCFDGGNPTCAELDSCYDSCAGDAGCASDCLASLQAGAADHDKLVGCACEHCKVSCAFVCQ